MIKVLPDSVANQIAAGEVIQRPASVVKELVENAVDAGSTHIDVIVKDAGRTLVQVIDNGCGMNETDARLSFERHATSKISSADDLTKLYTFGFRGEALASIASIAEVELKTRCQNDETGTKIVINASELESQDVVSCPIGTSFSIKNIFFNVPARRKFLKSDNVEMKHIVTEFQRVALCNPNVEFTLSSNGTSIYNLPKGNYRQRIADIFGRQMNNNIINVKVETSIVKIEGYVGKADQTKKQLGDQYFFVNGRFFKSAYFQKSVFNAYDKLIAWGTYPSFFLYLTVNPEHIDVNIHPTKVEIKFSDEQTIWQILNAAVREALGKFALSPRIDFDTDGAIDIPVISASTKIVEPKIDVDDSYNPFNEQNAGIKQSNFPNTFKRDKNPVNWEKLFEDAKNAETSQTERMPENAPTVFNTAETSNKYIQLKGGYIATPMKTGLMIIDQRRAHLRVLFEQYLRQLNSPEHCSQQDIFPKNIELGAFDFVLLAEHLPDLQKLGFDIHIFGTNSVVVYGLPTNIKGDAEKIVFSIIEDLKDENSASFATKSKERLALALAQSAAVDDKTLTAEEMSNLAGRLFACQNPNLSPLGKPVLIVISYAEIDKMFMK